MKYVLPLPVAMIAVVASFPFSAVANSLSGGLHFSGDLTITTDTNPSSPTFGAGTITFNDVTATTHTFTIDSGTGDFGGFSGQGDEKTIGTASAPIDTLVNIADFLTFVSSPVTFTLTEVYGGVDPPAGCSANVALEANGNLCSPFGTPFNLQDIAPNGTNSTASFVVLGFLTSNGTNTPAIITFTAASTGKSFERLLSDQQAGLADTITYGAQLQALAPEPSTWRFMLAGCLLMAFGIFRRRRVH